ncbi:glycosyltransferase family 2 protein [Halapricum salinum]|uniref:Glycosyltransferase family 2 protein n=2 Tax=Halapricum salinum TaxID=1457250 RepID=A0A4D6HIL0_9EURY|nr:glycosyltransferase family 2 protein [Halapricum salinum]
MNDSSMETPLVSVVVPTYNRPEKLRRAVETVRAQTYRPIELVVVDDHSAEPAADALDEIALDDISLTVIRHEQNRGGNAARNTGIRESTGGFVAFLDDDDRWEPAKIQRQVETFEASPDSVGFVYTGSRYVYDDGERVICNDLSGDVTRAILEGASVAEFSAVMVRASVIEAAGLPDERFPSWQDQEWFLRLSLHCAFAAVEEPLTIRHWDHPGRIGQNFQKRRDVSFPLFVEKHRDLAAEYDLEQRFVASLLETLVIDAAQNGYYGDARRLAVRAIRTDPTLPTPWLYLLSCLGGRVTYRPAQRLMALVQSSGGRDGD